jgi:protein-tyrosine-phosphatase
MPKPKVLFICLINSCRSIMAEALTRHRCGDRWEAVSAGLAPLGWVAPETLEALAEVGVSTAALRSKGLNEFDLSEFCLVVNLSTHSLEERISPADAARVIHRPVPDPFGCNREAYRRSRDAIEALIVQELCGEKATLGK